MLVATWVLAISTTILAVSGPIALFQWRSNRKRDRKRRQRDRMDAMKADIMKDADRQFVSKANPMERRFNLSIGAILVCAMIPALAVTVKTIVTSVTTGAP